MKHEIKSQVVLMINCQRGETFFGGFSLFELLRFVSIRFLLILHVFISRFSVHTFSDRETFFIFHSCLFEGVV